MMTTPCSRRGAALAPVACLLILGLTGRAAAMTHQVNDTQPALDRWFYPFCCSFPATGGEFETRIFGATTPTGFDPMFDNRDGQMLVIFNTADDVPTGQGVANYTITAATVKIMVSSDLTFSYDTTSDPWTSWLPPSNPSFTADPDPGRAIELFGTAWRNGFTALTFAENGPYSAVGPFGKGIRNAFPINFTAPGASFDISNNVDMSFDPVPWAIGTNASLAQGQSVPAGTDLTFQISLGDANIHNYLRQAVNAGRVAFSIASIFPAAQEVGGTFPRLYTKEHPSVVAGLASAARLQMTVIVGPPPITGDLNHDGHVDGLDVGILLAAWSIPPSAPGCGGASPCEADLNNDGHVDGLDIGILLGNWTG